jgi:C4-dicarboxylate-specific signal transduction histidine kinase
MFKTGVSMSLNLKVNSSFGHCIIIKLDTSGKVSSINTEGSEFIKRNCINLQDLIKDLFPYYNNYEKSLTISLNNNQFILNIVKYLEGYSILLNPVDCLTTKNQESINVSVDDLHKMRLLTLGEMTSGIIHDINNPVGICLSAVELGHFLADELQSELKNSGEKEKLSEIIEKLSEIKSGISRITEISEGVKMLVHKNQVAYTVKDLSKVVEQSSAFCSSYLRKYKIDFKINQPQKEINVKLKESLISQILVNLIKNASDAIKDLPLHKKWIQISFEENKDYYILKVEDGGEGIPKEIQEKIFEPFFTTKDVGVGTGLGLSLCKQIMKIHSGTIEIDNNSKNTTFLLYFPKEKNCFF